MESLFHRKQANLCIAMLLHICNCFMIFIVIKIYTYFISPPRFNLSLYLSLTEK